MGAAQPGEEAPDGPLPAEHASGGGRLLADLGGDRDLEHPRDRDDLHQDRGTELLTVQLREHAQQRD